MMSYSKSCTVKILRTIHKVVLRCGMTREDIGAAIGNIPSGLRINDITYNDELGTVKLEFLEENEEASK